MGVKFSRPNVLNGEVLCTPCYYQIRTVTNAADGDENLEEGRAGEGGKQTRDNSVEVLAVQQAQSVGRQAENQHSSEQKNVSNDVQNPTASASMLAPESSDQQGTLQTNRQSCRPELEPGNNIAGGAKSVRASVIASVPDINLESESLPSGTMYAENNDLTSRQESSERASTTRGTKRPSESIDQDQNELQAPKRIRKWGDEIHQMNDNGIANSTIFKALRNMYDHLISASGFIHLDCGLDINGKVPWLPELRSMPGALSKAFHRLVGNDDMHCLRMQHDDVLPSLTVLAGLFGAMLVDHEVFSMPLAISSLSWPNYTLEAIEAELIDTRKFEMLATSNRANFIQRNGCEIFTVVCRYARCLVPHSNETIFNPLLRKSHKISWLTCRLTLIFC